MQNLVVVYSIVYVLQSVLSRHLYQVGVICKAVTIVTWHQFDSKTIILTNYFLDRSPHETPNTYQDVHDEPFPTFVLITTYVYLTVLIYVPLPPPVIDFGADVHSSNTRYICVNLRRIW